MPLQKTVLWLLVSSLTLAIVSFTVEGALARALLSGLAISPILYFAWDGITHLKMIAKRRSFLGLRKVTDDFLEQVRNLNRLKMVSQTDGELAEAEVMIDRVIDEMHTIVEQIRVVAGQTGPAEATIPPTTRPKAKANEVKEPASKASGQR